MKKIIPILAAAIIMPLSTLAQQSISGDWEGFIDAAGNQLTIVTHFTDNDTSYSGTLDIPQQGAMGLGLQKINVTEQDSVFFEFFAGTGFAKFKGVRKDSSITGSFLQGGQSFPFQLKRKVNKILPYNSEDLLIENGDITIAGTLTTPKDQSAKTCVILLSGSGAQTRNSNVLGFKVFEQLADYLTTNDIATFRFDDRGTGKSTGNFTNTTLGDLTTDVNAIINYFRADTRNSFNRILLLGHSQGGIVAGKVAATNQQVNGLILMASPGVTLANVVIEQVEILNKQQNLADSVITQNIKLQKAIFDTLRGSQDFSQFPNTLPKNQLNYMQSPAYFSLLDHDPTKDLQMLDIPVLALFGGKDTQVTVEQNKEPIEKALDASVSKYKVESFDSANHLFQHAKSGAASEYGQLEPEFIDGFLSSIEEWIRKTF